MDIFDSLFENKKQLYIVGSIYFLVVIIVLINIWKPSNKVESEIIKYTEYDEVLKSRDMANYYFNQIINDFNNIIDKNISEEYLEYNNITKNDVKSKYNIDSNAIIDGLTITNSGENVIYSSTINYVGGIETINLIESYPYEYKVTFGDFISYTTDSRSYLSNGIMFSINSIYRNKDYVLYDFSITNKENEYINIDFSDTSKIYLVTNDGQKHYLTNNSMESNSSKITKKGSINKVLVFSISTAVQGSIDTINFNKVIINGNSVDITFYI